MVPNQMTRPIEDCIKWHANETQNNKNVPGRPIIPIIPSDRIIMKYGDHIC